MVSLCLQTFHLDSSFDLYFSMQRTIRFDRKHCNRLKKKYFRLCSFAGRIICKISLTVKSVIRFGSFMRLFAFHE